ncbi:MAG: S1 RNA-binding domain-containing protein, partial [Hyphomonadaceae bacterium]|nr:S1 RNA-binding domain-containing protein [Clostridia bacterium]
IRVDDGEGNVLLSKKKVDAIKGWKDVAEAFESGAVLKGRVVDVVKGGMNAISNGVSVFIPASQASDRYLADLSGLKGKEVSFKIIDINEKRRRAVGSVKAILLADREIKSVTFWETAEVGKKYTGVVKKLTDFGAFVDIGGVDGLIHISELSWQRVKHPSEVVNEGDTVEVYIADLNLEKKKISLGYKKPEDNPIALAKEKFKEGDVITCKVLRLVPFGAFVELLPGIDGLIHISQISDKRIAKPQDVLTVGQMVEAKIITIDLENKKISLSIRELIEPSVEVEVEAPEAIETPVTVEAPSVVEKAVEALEEAVTTTPKTDEA